MEFKAKPDNCAECPFFNTNKITDSCAVANRIIADKTNRAKFCFMDYTYIAGNVNINITLNRGDK